MYLFTHDCDAALAFWLIYYFIYLFTWGYAWIVSWVRLHKTACVCQYVRSVYVQMGVLVIVLIVLHAHS